jgi:hypothetical protein
MDKELVNETLLEMEKLEVMVEKSELDVMMEMTKE